MDIFETHLSPGIRDIADTGDIEDFKISDILEKSIFSPSLSEVLNSD